MDVFLSTIIEENEVNGRKISPYVNDIEAYMQKIAANFSDEVDEIQVIFRRKRRRKNERISFNHAK